MKQKKDRWREGRKKRKKERKKNLASISGSKIVTLKNLIFKLRSEGKLTFD